MSEKNSKSSTTASTKSKRFTALGTAIRKPDILKVDVLKLWKRRRRPQTFYPEAEERIQRRWKKSSDRIRGLTTRILAVNVIAIMILGVGILYLGQYTENLIEAELQAMKAEARFTAGAILEGAMRPVLFESPYDGGQSQIETKAINPALARSMVRTLGSIGVSRIQLFNIEGTIMADSHLLIGPGGVVEIEQLGKQEPDLTLNTLFSQSAIRFLDLIPVQTKLPQYPSDDLSERFAFGFQDTQNALNGDISATAWFRDEKEIVLSAAAPIQNVKQVTGVVLLVRDGEELQASIDEVRVDVFRVFLGALGATVMLSIYLSGIISQPLQRLAAAAESVRMGKGQQIEIPDMSERNDEIGELSIVLRDMTQALWDRMDTIERFAADVAHEIKNPLTSLRSAVETASRVKDDDARKKLMDIIHHDVQRLDRLISDISSASRLDAELSREEMGMIDLKAVLVQLQDAYKKPLKRLESESADDTGNIKLHMPESNSVSVMGNADRLGQVFGNLIGNALSFSPDDKQVHVRVTQDQDMVRVTVEDSGPGIPENKLETIFERFYTERPAEEDYGSHSGLGLSISKQIIKAHGGEIWAENIENENSDILGARFNVLLRRDAG
ncbi:MAG: stimulus-sensing domain-containing protein [Pseudomonadota bacterium]